MKNLSAIIALVLVFNLCTASNVWARQDTGHVVSRADLRAALAEESSRRARAVEEVREMLSHDLVRSQIGGLVDLDKIEKKIPTLDDETLAQLAADSRLVNDRLQGGISSIAWIAIIVVAVSIVIVAG